MRITQPQLTTRGEGNNPNHHIWNNNGTLWCHFTLHLPGYTKKRTRKSLKPKRIDNVRYRRDRLFSNFLNESVNPEAE